MEKLRDSDINLESNPNPLNAPLQMLSCLMSIDHRCFDIFVAENPAHCRGINSVHLHQTVESMSQIMDPSQALDAGSFGHFDKPLPQGIPDQSSLSLILKNIPMSLAGTLEGAQ